MSSYVKKTWVTKEIIKGVDLNHIEDGIANLDERMDQEGSDTSKMYRTTDVATTSLGNNDYFPIYTSEGSRKKILFSNIKSKILSWFGEWAKQPNKPTYTASEVNAVSTVANQGLSETQKANARSNIGAGASTFSGSYNDLTDKPTIGNASLILQKNGTTVKTFTANATSNVTANITVPTKVSELSNDSNYITSASIPTVNNAKLTIQKNGTPIKVFTANASSDVSCNITVPTKTSDLENDSGFVYFVM